MNDSSTSPQFFMQTITPQQLFKELDYGHSQKLTPPL